MSLAAGTATGQGSDTLTGIERVLGSANADDITGDGNANSLDGGAGNDTLLGGAGDDTLEGGAIRTRRASRAGGVTGLERGHGDGPGQRYPNIEHVLGSGNADNITGSAGNNSLDGGGGDGTIAAAPATTRWRAERIPTRPASRGARP